MPKFTVQFLRSTGAVADPTTDTTDKLKRWVVGVNLVSGHHSNGGETCEFVDEDPDNECQSSLQPPPAPEDREFMVTPGNFSTNYFELGVNVRRAFSLGTGQGNPAQSTGAWSRILGAEDEPPE